MNHDYHTIDHFAWVSITGEKTTEFLQGQFTCDVNALNNNQACWGAYCDPKGRVIANFFLLKWHKNYYVLLPQTMETIFIETISKYAPFSRVKVHAITPPGILTGISHPPVFNKKYMLDYCLWSLNSVDNTHIMISANDANPPITQQLQQQQFQAMPHQQWQLYLIHTKTAFVQPATSARFLPQTIMPNTPHAISFTKGCYVGQEVIARTEHLGQLKRHLQQRSITTHHTPNVGDLLSTANHTQAGVIVSLIQQEENQYQCLTVLQDRFDNQPLFFNPLN